MRKYVSLLLSAALLLCLASVAVFAAGTPTVSLRVDKTIVAPGERITLSLVLDADVKEKVSGWQWNIIWDGAYFDLTEVRAGSAAQGVTPVINGKAPTTDYAPPYQTATVTQGSALTPHSLRKGTLASVTLTAKQTLPATGGTRFYIDGIAVMDDEGMPLAVVTTDSRYEWGEDAAVLPDDSVGCAVSWSTAAPPVTTQPPTDPTTPEPTTPEPTAPEPTTPTPTTPKPTTPEPTAPEPTVPGTTESTTGSTGSGWFPLPSFTVPETTPQETELEHFTVTFQSGDGSMTVALTVAPGEMLPEPEEPKREGYIFNGWYTAQEGGTLWNFGSGRVTENMTLYAGWLAEDASPAEPETTSGIPLWMVAAVLLLLAGGAALYVLLGRKRVSFDTCGGTPMDPVYVKRNALLERPMTPVKPGAMFLGWYTSAEGGIPWNFEQRKVRKGMTLYARWR